MENIVTVSERLRKLRKEKCWTQSDVSTKLGVSTSAYGYYESGDRNPNSVTLIKLAKIHKVSVDYLLGLSEYSKTAEYYLKTLSNIDLGDKLISDDESIEVLNKIFNMSKDINLTKTKLKALLNVFHSLKHYIIISIQDI
jgi:transcriptional regulator with XRE-family HTH domain